MFKKVFSVFLTSYSESLKLEARYRAMTTRLGWATVALSCFALLFFMYATWSMFGLPLKGGSIEGLRLKLIAWVVLVIAIVPVAFYAGMFLVNGACGLILFSLGHLTWQQVIDFSIRAKYPTKWYKPIA